MKEYWWIQTSVPENEQASGCIRFAYTHRSYSEIKKAVWRLFRLRSGWKELKSSDKMIYWAMSERFRVQSMSCSDSVGYLAKMVGVSRKTASRSIQNLVDAGVVWIVEEGEVRKAHKRLVARKYFKKHFLLVGLSYMLAEGVG